MNEKDIELLPLAAKAAGWCYVARPYGGHLESGTDGPRPWNPLDDNGDALSLMLHLGLMLDYQPCCKIRIWNLDISVTVFWGGVGLEAATRRAIVHAAAELGRAM